MTSFVTSRLAGGVNYAFYQKGPNGINTVYKTICIKGGSDVVDKKTLLTPQGVVTEVSKEDLALLETNPVFKMHVENGYITITDNEKAANKAGEKLEVDKSSQITDEDYENGNDKKQMVAAPKKKPRTKKG